MTNSTTRVDTTQNKQHFEPRLSKGVWLADTAPQPKRQQIGHDIYTTYAKDEPVDLTVPEGHRALIVSPTDDGGYTTKTVSNGDSVLNVRTELIGHLEDLHLSDKWLSDLKAWIDRKLVSREQVRERHAQLKAKREAQL